MQHLRTASLLLVLIASTTCGAPSPISPLANTHASAVAVADAVLDAVARRDAAALRALGLSEQEFREHVWPELPSARPERNLPFSFVWGDLQQKSDAGLQTTMAAHGGTRYQLQRVEFAGDTKYPGYVVHRASTFVVRDAAGHEQQLRLCGSMLEKNSRWKVFSFVLAD